MTTPIAKIETATKVYAEARTVLAALVTELDDEITATKRAKLAAIKRAVIRAAERQKELRDLIEANPDDFKKPKSRILHGIKVGFAKQPGAIEITDEADTLKRIHTIYKTNAGMLKLLIKTTEKPIKDGLAGLTADELKKIGVKVSADTNKVIIKPVDSEVDKIVDALLSGESEEE